MEWIIRIPVLFFSVIFHEFSHGWIAHKNGDDTAYQSGRLTLNPLPHIDPLGTLILPALCILGGMPIIGWAKPVPVNPYFLRNPKTDIMKVAAAGPLSNLFLALVSAVGLRLALSMHAVSADFSKGLLQLFFSGFIINLSLAFFNLLPVAPLDGSQILAGVLRGKWLDVYQKHYRYALWILFGFIAFGIVGFWLRFCINVALYFFLITGILPEVAQWLTW